MAREATPRTGSVPGAPELVPPVAGAVGVAIVGRPTIRLAAMLRPGSADRNQSAREQCFAEALTVIAISAEGWATHLRRKAYVRGVQPLLAKALCLPPERSERALWTGLWVPAARPVPSSVPPLDGTILCRDRQRVP